ncbi:unnamed protein product [Blepharisma stoltei]|uniref:Protein kinase domain-containing protein n=1 Tax=Blepharisma stoltei TaxID=1481888 RepID=A0AAU9JD58_9CILI|nr:unnamed protein product [Blepharisma stoltei]
MFKRKIRAHGSSQDFAEPASKASKEFLKVGNRIRISSKDEGRRISKSEKTSPVTTRIIKNLAIEIQPPAHKDLHEYVKKRIEGWKEITPDRQSRTPARSPELTPKQTSKPGHRRVVSDKISSIFKIRSVSRRNGNNSFQKNTPINSKNDRSLIEVNQSLLQERHTPTHLYENLNVSAGSFQEQEEEKEKLVSYISSYFGKHLDDPPTTLDFYKIGKMIGKGAFGKVLLGVHKLTGMNVAIKTIEKAQLRNEHAKRKVFQEVYILKKIRNKYVVKIFEVFESSKHFLIVMEYAGGGDLLQFVKQKGRLTENEARRIFGQIIEGAIEIHENGVLHRDFKLDNILLDSQYSCCKICDFGVSKLVKKGQIINEQCGTPAYLAPEIIVDRGYEGFWADMWSLGILAYAMLCGTVPFKAHSIPELNKLILTGKYNLPDYLSENAKDMIRSMLQLVPHNRIPLDSLLRHPWFRSSDETEEESVSPRFIGNIEPSREKRFKVDDFILEKVVACGFPKSFVLNSLNCNELNHATATYYLLHDAIH